MKNIFKKQNQLISIVVFAVFIYTLISAFIFQKFIFPHMPSLSNSLGLLKGDNELFHNLAVTMANNIKFHGWHQWKLFPMDFAAGINVGVLAGIYVFFGANPLFILPINAILHTAAFYVLYKIYFYISKEKLKAILAALPFVLLPTTILWTSQVHKDSYAIVSWMLIFYCLLIIRSAEHKRVIIFSFLGVVLIAIARPLYLNLVTLIASAVFFIYLITVMKNKQLLKSFFNSVIFLICSLVILFTFRILNPADNAKDEYYFVDAISCPAIEWHPSFLPDFLDKKFRVMAGIRSRLLCHQPTGTTSTIDEKYQPTSFSEIIGYLPKATMVSLFYPTPLMLFKISNIKSITVILEMLLFYITFPFMILYLINKKSKALILVVGVALFCEIFLSYINPNMGTYHRIRYPFFTFMLGLGILGFLSFFKGKHFEKK